MKTAVINNTNFSANKMSLSQAKYMDNEFRKAKTADIICHDMTDRDGANSALAMWEYLTSLGINSRVILQQKTPKMLGLRRYDFDFMQADNKEEIEKIIPDIAFCVDFGEKERIKPNVLEHIKKAGKIMGFDHHLGQDIIDENCVLLNSQLKDNEIPQTKVAYYTDTTAKSATSVIYRYFEALNLEIDNKKAYDLFLGLVDDGVKRGIISCDGESGTISPKKELLADTNAYEIYSKLKEKLNDGQIASIAKSVDIIASLNDEQKMFKNSLEERMKLSKNKKIAYVEIPSDDLEWIKLGGDNTVTSTILNRFRTSILNNPKYEDVKIVFSFYEANGTYRLSAHTKDCNLLDYFKYVEDNSIPNFTKNSGGHPNRGGAGFSCLEPSYCHKWVQDIVSNEDYFN